MSIIDAMKRHAAMSGKIAGKNGTLPVVAVPRWGRDTLPTVETAPLVQLPISPRENSDVSPITSKMSETLEYQRSKRVKT